MQQPYDKDVARLKDYMHSIHIICLLYTRTDRQKRSNARVDQHVYSESEEAAYYNCRCGFCEKLFRTNNNRRSVSSFRDVAYKKVFRQFIEWLDMELQRLFARRHIALNHMRMSHSRDRSILRIL
jgi:hypothetical protein